MTIYISNFYLNTPMERPEYMRLKISDMPNNIIEQYKLNEKVNPSGYVYVKIQKGMYGLSQAGKHSPKTTGEKTKRKRILPKQNNTRILDPQVDTNLICPLRR